MRTSRRGLVSVSIVLGLIGGGVTRPPLAGAKPTAEVRPSLPPPLPSGRLPTYAVPERYSLSLVVDPNGSRFSGVMTIELQMSEETNFVVLHARGLRIEDARGSQGGHDQAVEAFLRPAAGGVEPEELVLRMAVAFHPGKAVVRIAYDAPFDQGLDGVFRTHEGGRSYVFTNFEPVNARRAFPCFDEPAWRAPLDLTITTPANLMVFANAKLAREVAGKGTTTHVFESTLPLSTYLVAFAVGEFDVVEGEKDPYPIRIIVPKGAARLAKGALPLASGLVKKFEAYFGIPYPYSKLDLIASPEYAAGAMEQPGLMMFREELLLVDGPQGSALGRRNEARYIAHELAHQWFGDLVTPAWWNDVWLNEGFATWAETQGLDWLDPGYAAGDEAVLMTDRVMDRDALLSAPQVRPKVNTSGEASASIDRLAYVKGAAVLSMLEGGLGRDVFQRGVQHYLRSHAWGTATADDLFRALEFVSARDVHPVADPLLETAGVPRLAVTLRCKPRGGLSFSLSESEWVPFGRTPRPPNAWTLPFCTKAEGIKTPTCGTVRGPIHSEEAGSGRCPSWVYPNMESASYFRFSMAEGDWRAVARGLSNLSPRERIGFIADLWAEVRAGHVQPGLFFDLLPAFDAETNAFVVIEEVDAMRDAARTIVDRDARPAFEKYVAARLRGQKRRLGWAAKPGEVGPAADVTGLARLAVVRALGNLSHDDETLTESAAYAERWLANDASVPSDLGQVAVELAAIHGGEFYFEKLENAAVEAKTPSDRVALIKAMVALAPVAVLPHVFDRLLNGGISRALSRYLVRGLDDYPEAHSAYFEWVKAHWDPMLARFPGDLAKRTLSVAAKGLCDAAHVADAKEFLTPRLSSVEGAAGELQLALDDDDLCLALRNQAAAATTAWFLRKH